MSAFKDPRVVDPLIPPSLITDLILINLNYPLNAFLYLGGMNSSLLLWSYFYRVGSDDYGLSL